MSIFSKLKDAIFGRKENAPARVNPPLTSPSPSPAATAVAAPVDVEAILEQLASESKQKLDWRHSIVDLMKLVGMESTLTERKELATELGYQADMSDSARMNMWLHKEVMRQLAANGGKVPANLLD